MNEEKKTSNYAKSLREMYELGVKHGRVLAQKEAHIKKLEEELVDIKLRKITDNSERG